MRKPFIRLLIVTALFDPKKTFTKTLLLGSSTACVLVVHQETLYSANLGDSGFMVVRNGRVITKSEEQVHYFNAPFQLTLPPEGKIVLPKGDSICLVCKRAVTQATK